MLWERAPPRSRCGEDTSTTHGSPSPAGGVSKELLRRICEPFFEQMIVALMAVVNAPQSPYPGDEEAYKAYYQTNHSSQSQLDQLQEDEASSEPSDACAFSAVLVGSSVGSPWQTCPLEEKAISNGPVCTKVSGGAKNKDQDKSDKAAPATVIVCRHWKSKGWCRMESGCKFAHPDHKCGVGAPNGVKGSDKPAEAGTGPGGATGGDAQAASISSDDEAGAPADGQKKPGRKRRSRAKGSSLVAPGSAGGVPTILQALQNHELSSQLQCSGS